MNERESITQSKLNDIVSREGSFCSQLDEIRESLGKKQNVGSSHQGMDANEVRIAIMNAVAEERKKTNSLIAEAIQRQFKMHGLANHQEESRMHVGEAITTQVKSEPTTTTTSHNWASMGVSQPGLTTEASRPPHLGESWGSMSMSPMGKPSNALMPPHASGTSKRLTWDTDLPQTSPRKSAPAAHKHPSFQCLIDPFGPDQQGLREQLFKGFNALVAKEDDAYDLTTQTVKAFAHNNYSAKKALQVIQNKGIRDDCTMGDAKRAIESIEQIFLSQFLDPNKPRGNQQHNKTRAMGGATFRLGSMGAKRKATGPPHQNHHSR
jgi:hypothetical protein